MAEGGNRPARRAGLLPRLSRRRFFEGGFRLAKCHVVAKTQGYQLVFIWGSQIKFQGGWTGLKGPAWCYTGFEEFLYQLLVPVKQGLVSRSNGGGVVSSLMPGCCTDTWLSCGLHLG